MQEHGSSQSIERRTASAPDRNPKHFNYIDALRGIAFLGVLAIHSAITAGPFPGWRVLIRGDLGVQLFFLVSAITLCYSMSSRQSRDELPVTFFYLRRLFRIAPLFWLALIFYGSFPSVIPDDWMNRGQFATHWYYFPLTACFLNGWHPYTFSSIVPGGWTIAVEMTFYLIFPFLFKYINSLERAAALSLAGVLLTRLETGCMNHFHAYLYPGVANSVFFFFSMRWFPSQLTVFVIGILAYHLLQLPVVRSITKSTFWSIGILIASLSLLLSVILGTSGLVPAELIAVLLLSLIVLVMSGGKIPFLVNPIICYIGRISYSCYLIHFAALGITFRILNIPFEGILQSRAHEPAMVNFTLFVEIFSLSLLLTIPAATLTMHLIENPGIAAGRSLIKRISVNLNKSAAHSK